MSEIFTSILIIGTEISAILLVFFAIFIFFQRKKTRREKKIKEQFISTFKENLDVRRSHIENQLTKLDQDKEEILQIIENVLSMEKNIYAKMLKIFNGEEKNLILDMQDDLQELTDQFGVHLVVKENNAPALTPEIETRIADVEKKNNVLRTENDRLKEDLKKALETIDSIQAEYEQLYNKTRDMEQNQ